MSRSTARLRVLAWSVAFLVLASAAFGGGQRDRGSTGGAAGDGALVSSTPFEITMLVSDNASYPWNADWPIVQQLKAKTNVTFKTTLVPIADYVTKFNLLLNTNDIPDMVQYWGGVDWQQFALNGKMVAIDLAKFPNLQATINKWNLRSDWDNMALADGKNYALPMITEKPVYIAGPTMRLDILKKVNMSVPKTHEELRAVLKAMKRYDPNSLPLTAFWGSDALMNFLGRSYGDFEVGGWAPLVVVDYDYDQKKYISAMTHPKLRAMLTFLRDLNTDGSFDQELFTQDVDQWIQKIASSRSFASYGWNDQNAQLNGEGRKTNPEFNYENVPIPVGYGMKENTFVFNSMAPNMFITSAAARDKARLEKIIKMADYMYYNEEAQIAGNWGVLGTSYTQDASGKRMWTPEYQNAPLGPGRTAQQNLGSSYVESLTGILYYDYLLANLTPPAQALSLEMAKARWVPAKLAPRVTPDETEEIRLLVGPLTDLLNKSIQAFVIGDKDPARDWDAYVKEAEAKGINKVVDMYNKAMTR